MPLDIGVELIRVESAAEMRKAAVEAFSSADIAICAAAVADYRPDNVCDRKIKREHEEIPTIRLVKNPDIAASLGEMKRPGQILVGFALETDNERSHAADKLARKHLDMIVLNSLRDKGAGFGTDTNKITLLFADGREAADFDLCSKQQVATDIFDNIATL